MGRTKRLNRKKRPRSRQKSRVRKDTLKRRYALMRTLRKSKKSKKSKTKKSRGATKKDVVKAGLRKEDSSKYIGLLNLALKHIYQGSKIDDVFLS